MCTGVVGLKLLHCAATAPNRIIDHKSVASARPPSHRTTGPRHATLHVTPRHAFATPRHGWYEEALGMMRAWYGVGRNNFRASPRMPHSMPPGCPHGSEKIVNLPRTRGGCCVWSLWPVRVHTNRPASSDTDRRGAPEARWQTAISRPPRRSRPLQVILPAGRPPPRPPRGGHACLGRRPVACGRRASGD